MSACGEWTKMEGFSLGDDSRHSCASVAFALYVKEMELASFPSYNTCLWCSARWMSLSDLNLKVLCRGKRKKERKEKKKVLNTFPRELEECGYKFNAPNAECLIDVCVLCKQHCIILMSTALTRTLIQLKEDKRWRGEADMWRRKTLPQLTIYLLFWSAQ